MRARDFIVVGVTLGLGALPLVACRSIVGIADLELVDGGSAADAGGDGGAASAEDAGSAADAGGDGGAGAALVAQCLAAANGCRRCCKESSRALRDFEQSASSCICPRCATQCPSGCPPPPSQTPGTPDGCRVCIDDVLAEGSCNAECKSPDCLAGLTCIGACP